MSYFWNSNPRWSCVLVDFKAEILIVDDDSAVCFSLSQVFRSLGYAVRTAEGGFDALREMNIRYPDILLSDLNMPQMSGFELLSITRRKFPFIYAIGMTGAFIDRLPEGIAADAFYRKASGFGILFDLVRIASEANMDAVSAERTEAPIWITLLEDTYVDGKRVYIGCPECLRAFPQTPSIDVPLDRFADHLALETTCAYCSAPINYAVVEAFA
jgi:CheY-like chemotaxis protein